MISLGSFLVLATLAMLVVSAILIAFTRARPESVGFVAGVCTFNAGIALLFVPNHLLGDVPLIDAVSLPVLPLTGLGLSAVFAVVPRRALRRGSNATLLLFAAAQIVLMMSPPGWTVGVLWAVACALTVVVLPDGAARRLALPFLTLAAGAGLVGAGLGGTAGTWLILFAVVLRMGLFPFHTWMVGAYTLAPLTMVVAVTAPMQAMALVARTPTSLHTPGGLSMAFFLVIGAVLTAGLALVQDRLPRSVGFLFTSVSALTLLAVLDSDQVGHLGGLIMWGITGIALMGMGLVVAALQSRGAGLRLDKHSGLFRSSPTFAGLFLLFGLTMVGAPGTADFASEDLVLHGGIAHHPFLLVLFISAVSLQAYAVLRAFYRVFLGPPQALPVPDVLPRERRVFYGLAILLVGAGLAPQIMVHSWLNGRPQVADMSHPTGIPVAFHAAP